MKLLLDENIPRKLKRDLNVHEVYHVSDKGWQGKKNGQLLALMLEDGFDALITIDKNLKYQQNFKKYPIPVLVLAASDNTYLTLQPFAKQILNTLTSTKLNSGAIEITI